MLSEGTGQAEGHGDVAGSEGCGPRLLHRTARAQHQRGTLESGGTGALCPSHGQPSRPGLHADTTDPGERLPLPGERAVLLERGGRAWTAGWHTPAQTQASAGCSR